MSFRILFTSVVVATLVLPTQAWAQEELEDDLLAPLTPDDGETPKRKKKKAAPRQELPGDDLLVPLTAPTELIVTMAESLPGAKLFIDGKEIGPVTGAPIEVSPGEHRLVVKRAGYNDFQGTVAIPDGGRESVTVSMFANGGILAVQPNVPAADVFIDGKLIGKAPIRELVLKPGTYEVRVTKAGYSAEIEMLSVRAGKDYTLTPKLMPALQPDRPEKPRLEPVASANGAAPPVATQLGGTQQVSTAGTPWYGQWYVWAGAAAVVAAAAGGTVAAMSPPAPWSREELCPSACVDVVNGKRTARRVMIGTQLAF